MNFVDNTDSGEDAFQSLSIKQLSNLIQAKCLELPASEAVTIRHCRSTIVDKNDIVRLCYRCIDESEITRLLGVDLDKPNEGHILSAPILVEESLEKQKLKQSFTRKVSIGAFDDGHSLRGMLLKRGRGRTTFIRPWTERFVVLDYSLLTLRYWDIPATTARTLNLDSSLPSSTDLKGEIDVRGCTIEPLTVKESGKSNAFRILLNGEEMITLATTTVEESQEWINALLKATSVREHAANETRKKIAEATHSGRTRMSSTAKRRPTDSRKSSSEINTDVDDTQEVALRDTETVNDGLDEQVVALIE